MKRSHSQPTDLRQTKRSSTPTGKQTLSLVRRTYPLPQVFYPRTDTDYSLLSALRIPITQVSVDYYPLLLHRCKQEKVVINTVLFSDLETSALTKFQSHWKHEIAIDDTSITLSWPKTVKLDVSKYTDKLIAWYAKHSIKTEVVSKRTARAYKVFIRKVLD